MKIEKKKNERLEIRISMEEKTLLDYVAAKNGNTTSRYIRLMIQSIIYPFEKQIQQGEKTYDDFQALCDNFVQQRRIFKN